MLAGKTWNKSLFALLFYQGCQSMCDPWLGSEGSDPGADGRSFEEPHRDCLCQDLPTTEAYHCRGLPETGTHTNTHTGHVWEQPTY